MMVDVDQKVEHVSHREVTGAALSQEDEGGTKAFLKVVDKWEGDAGGVIFKCKGMEVPVQGDGSGALARGGGAGLDHDTHPTEGLDGDGQLSKVHGDETSRGTILDENPILSWLASSRFPGRITNDKTAFRQGGEVLSGEEKRFSGEVALLPLDEFESVSGVEGDS